MVERDHAISTDAITSDIDFGNLYRQDQTCGSTRSALMLGVSLSLGCYRGTYGRQQKAT